MELSWIANLIINYLNISCIRSSSNKLLCVPREVLHIIRLFIVKFYNILENHSKVLKKILI